MYTTEEAAKYLGLKSRTIRSHIERGTLRSEKHGRDHFITTEEIQRFERERHRAGRPPQKRRTN